MSCDVFQCYTAFLIFIINIKLLESPKLKRVINKWYVSLLHRQFAMEAVSQMEQPKREIEFDNKMSCDYISMLYSFSNYYNISISKLPVTLIGTYPK